MPFDREAAKAAGYSDQEIDGFLAGDAGPDSSANPRAEVSEAGMFGDLGTGLAAGGLAAGGLGLGAMALKRFGGNPAVRVIAKHLGRSIPVLGPIMAARDEIMAARQPAEAPPRANKKPAAKGKKAAGKPNPRAKSKVPTRDITVEGKPAKAPAQTENPRYTGGRGASGRELERRAAMLAGEPLPGTVASRLAAERALADAPDPELWRTRGISAPRSAAGNILPGALHLLPFILSGATAQQDMEDAQRVYQEFLNRSRTPSLRRALQGTEGI